MPPKGLWIKSFIEGMNRCTAVLWKSIENVQVKHKCRPQGFRYTGHRYKRKKCRVVLHSALPCMTTTWAKAETRSRSWDRQFDSDSQTLMLDDGASACITNDRDDFIEPPKRVDRKVKGIKGHAHATHRGTLKWHIEDDHGLVHVMVIKGAYLIPTRQQGSCRLNILHNRQRTTTQWRRVQGP